MERFDERLRKTAASLENTAWWAPFGPPPVTTVGTEWAAAMADMTAQISGFVAGRIEENIRTQQALLTCRNLEEVRDVQSEFIERAVHQYQDQTLKLTEMAIKAMFPALPKG